MAMEEERRAKERARHEVAFLEVYLGETHNTLTNTLIRQYPSQHPNI